MCGKHKFFICKHCGNMVGLIFDKGVPLACCGDEMVELIPNTTEASTEKHLPVISETSNSISIQVGSAPHPMDEEHRITFVYVESECGGQRKCLKTGDAPVVAFSFTDDKPIAVYAYCNLHGLWKTEIE